MIRVLLHVKVKKGREHEFEDAWRIVAAYTQGIAGNLRQDLLRDPMEPGTFLICSDWESREAFHLFERSEEQDALTAPLRDLRVSATMTTYDLLVHCEKEMQV
jgi:heme-degrading monooxygenase HmoA